MFFTFWGICCSLGYIYIIFSRKILVLLMMECLFLFSFFFYFLNSSVSGGVFFFPIFLLVLFMVLDSVVGITLMLSISRVYGIHSNWFL